MPLQVIPLRHRARGELQSSASGRAEGWQLCSAPCQHWAPSQHELQRRLNALDEIDPSDWQHEPTLPVQSERPILISKTWTDRTGLTTLHSQQVMPGLSGGVSCETGTAGSSQPGFPDASAAMAQLLSHQGAYGLAQNQAAVLAALAARLGAGTASAPSLSGLETIAERSGDATASVSGAEGANARESQRPSQQNSF